MTQSTLRHGCLASRKFNEKACPSYSRPLHRCIRGFVNPAGTPQQAVWAIVNGLLKPCPLTIKGAKAIELAAAELKRLCDQA